MLSVTIVIPTRNEESNIETLLKQVKQYGYDIIVVDDSDDNTAEIANENGALVIIGQRKGLGQAIIDGINCAKTDVVLVMDADGSHSPEQIPDLLKPILEQGADMTIGSRYIEGGSVEGWTLKRRLISKVASLMAWGITRRKDNTSGFFAFRESIIEDMELEASSWKIMLEVLIKSRVNNAIEVPIEFKDRMVGKSKFNKREVFAYLRHLFTLGLYKLSHPRYGTEVRNHTIGMFLIGGFVWLLYLGYVNLLTLTFDVNHIVAEITGIPLSWIINYYLNTKYNFGMKYSVKRFISFCLVSLFGWFIYMGTTIVLSDVLNIATWIGTIVGVFTKTVSNVIFQQSITFGKFGERKKKQAKSTRASYDWDGIYKGNPIQKWWKKRILSETLAMYEGNPVIDIGCGSSPLLSMIKADDKYGIDMNKDKIEFISHKDNSSYYMNGDGTHTQFEDCSMSTVICNEVIEHHSRPNELVKELARIVKPNGVVIIATPDYASIIWNITEVFYGLLMHSGYELEHGSKFTETGLVSLCNAYGLEKEKIVRVAKSDMIIKFRKQE